MPSVVMPYIVIEIVTECNDWSCSIPILYVLNQLVSLVESTYLGLLLQQDIISFHLKNLVNLI